MKKIIFLALLILSSHFVFANKTHDELVDAVTNGTLEEIKKAFNKNFDYIKDNIGSDKKNLLMHALEANREYPVIQYIVRAGVNIDSLSRTKQTPLMIACQHTNDPEVIDYLVKKSRKTNAGRANYILKRDEAGNDAFDYALKNNNAMIVFSTLEKYVSNPHGLVEQDKGIYVVKEYDFTPYNNKRPKNYFEYDYDYEYDDDEIEAALAGIDIKKPDFGFNLEDDLANLGTLLGETEEEAEEVAEAGEEAEELELEIFENEEPADEIFADLDDIQTEIDPRTTSIFALNTNDTAPNQKDASKYLFDDSDFDSGDVPFDDYYYRERTFIENANRKDKYGRTPLMIASQLGDIETIKDLLYSGADVQAKDSDGWTPLMFASRYQPNPEATNLLIKSGAFVQAKNKHGITALNYAAGFNPNPMVLISLLRNRSITEKEIRSAFVYAICSQAPVAILNVFLKKGIQINVSYEGKTPLMYAAETNDKTEIIAWLLEHGATPQLQTPRGKTAFDFARENRKLPHDGVYWALNAE